eukprot:761042-Hanusia_phi.AAC.6
MKCDPEDQEESRKPAVVTQGHFMLRPRRPDPPGLPVGGRSSSCIRALCGQLQRHAVVRIVRNLTTRDAAWMPKTAGNLGTCQLHAAVLWSLPSVTLIEFGSGFSVENTQATPLQPIGKKQTTPPSQPLPQDPKLSSQSLPCYHDEDRCGQDHLSLTNELCEGVHVCLGDVCQIDLHAETTSQLTSSSLPPASSPLALVFSPLSPLTLEGSTFPPAPIELTIGTQLLRAACPIVILFPSPSHLILTCIRCNFGWRLTEAKISSSILINSTPPTTTTTTTTTTATTTSTTNTTRASYLNATCRCSRRHSRNLRFLEDQISPNFLSRQRLTDQGQTLFTLQELRKGYTQVTSTRPRGLLAVDFHGRVDI